LIRDGMRDWVRIHAQVSRGPERGKDTHVVGFGGRHMHVRGAA
jgi:hypothetical protein